ncbi:leucine rich repeat domain containing protein, putative [Eimeria tenella]|uniref:Leucine rich repeat domain containing protein, putative n=1 Tax=Eimeria tenella TaxID=5802 RepID=U6KIS3_EIMTE|nr:leucine rich repeat domain containing protein, putative [Eimeria tenella]CDJ37915.1 leucine rich repeat domain containing protein, putative [Eimeria tenella]|eukprot:XP_013228753.1 leucine rich repeat domain containing protein, putative [Eimeria tenella]
MGKASLPGPAEGCGPLAKAYLLACDLAGCEAKRLLFESLAAADLAQQQNPKRGVKIECIGSRPEGFLQRLAEPDLELLLQAASCCSAKIVLLNLAFNWLGSGAAAVFGAQLLLLQPLQQLVLAGNCIEEAAAANLCQQLLLLPRLSYLDLSFNQLKRKGGEAAAALLQNSKTLKTLKLRNTQLDLHALVHITTALQQSNRSLETLDISDVDVSFNSMHAYHLAGVVQLASNLLHLDLGRQALRDDGVEILYPFLRQNKTLRSLGLAANEISWRGGLFLGRLLSASPPLQFLDLNFNKLGDWGASCIAAGIESNDLLLVLLLRGNAISSKGLARIREALALNSTLEAVGLAGNLWTEAYLREFTQARPHFRRSEPLAVDLELNAAGRLQTDRSLPFYRHQQSATTGVCSPAAPATAAEAAAAAAARGVETDDEIAAQETETEIEAAAAAVDAEAAAATAEAAAAKTGTAAAATQVTEAVAGTETAAAAKTEEAAKLQSQTLNF